jgi:hypothetical protein
VNSIIEMDINPSSGGVISQKLRMNSAVGRRSEKTHAHAKAIP